MLSIYACDVDVIAVMGNAVKDCVSGGAVRRYPFVLSPLVSLEAIHPESGIDTHAMVLFCALRIRKKSVFRF